MSSSAARAGGWSTPHGEYDARCRHEQFLISEELQAISPEASAEDAVGGKLFSDKPSLIAGANDSARLGHVGDEQWNGDAVVVPPFVTNQPTFRDAVRSRDQRELEAYQLTAYGILCTG
jgi:hypothetical protein